MISRTESSSVRAAGRDLSYLARSCHPAPTVAVTVFSVVLAATAGVPAQRCLLLGGAVLAGQLSIGWSNDRLDAVRDRAAQRTDKPVANGDLPRGLVDGAIGLAIGGTVVLSLLLGWRAGLLHMAAVGCGWAYNLHFKATIWSWVPYALAFGALPGVATLAAHGHPAPAAWAVASGALLGVAANLTNALPDLAGDTQTGVHGLPHTIGAHACLTGGVALTVAATACPAFVPPGSPTFVSLVLFAIAVCGGVAGIAAFWSRPDRRAPFYIILGVVAMNLALIIANGHQLH